MDFSLFKGILFDLDGVLIDTMPLHYRAWKELAESLGFSVTQEEIYRREGEKGEITARDFLIRASQPVSESRIRELLDKKETLYRGMLAIKPVDGAEQLLRHLKSKTKKLGLVTGSSQRDIQGRLTESFLGYFECIVTSDMVLHSKPHPDPYQLALRMINLQRDEIVVIENAPYGISAAKAAGLTCVALRTSLPDSYLMEADLCLDKLANLLQLFR